jgi:hypothetical protein
MRKKTVVYVVGGFAAYQVIAYAMNSSAVKQGQAPTMPLDFLGKILGYSPPATVANAPGTALNCTAFTSAIGVSS